MRSDSRLGGYRTTGGFARNFDHHNSYVSNRSGVSVVHSEHLRKMVEEVEMYPSGFSELLKYEQRNIKTFKGQINREKQRVNDDMNVFKTQINHTLQDLRLSLHAHLDRVYQGYIQKYAKFKGQILQINRLKDQMQIETGSVNVLPKSNASTREFASSSISNNAQTISQMENNSKELKKYHFLNYIAELQKQRIFPLNDLHREIVILNQYNNGFYQSKEFNQVLASLKGFIQGEVQRVYDNSHLYIREVDAILFKEQPKILDQVYKGSNIFPQQPLNTVPISQRRDYIIQRPPVQQRVIYSTMPRPATQSNPRIVTQQKSERVINADQGAVGSPIYGEVSSSQQTVRVDWIEKINMVNSNKFDVAGSQIALCGINVNNQCSAFGMKDGSIQIITPDGQLLVTLRQHKASICSLALFKIKGQTYLASGSDIGCSRIILWDTLSWQPLQQFQNHKAAVTAIIDLQDNTHILSGSYDKKINIYNVEQGRFIYNLPANTTSVTGAIITKTGNKVITCGLDKALNVWQVSRNNGKVETLFLERKIQNDVLICSMVASALQNDLVVLGTKDGKIKMINVEKGEAYKTIVCGENYLIQMMLVERQSKPYYPLIIAWPYKDTKMFQVNSESGVVNTKSCNTSLQFGCGVSPKCFFLQRGGAICCVSHNEQAKQISTFRLQDAK